MIGAGISGLQYDGEAAFNAVVFHKQELSDASWGESIAVGAVLGGVGGAGAGRVMGRLGSKIDSGIAKLSTKLGAEGPASRVFSLFGAKGLTSKYILKQGERGALKTLKTAAMGLTKSVAASVAISTGWAVLKTMGMNLVEHKDIGEGVGRAAEDGIVGGVVGGGMSVLNI